MRIQLDSSSALNDAIEAIGESGLRHRVTVDRKNLAILSHDEDAHAAVYSLLCDLDLLDLDDSRFWPSENLSETRE
jgi:hypothetical protein